MCYEALNKGKCTRANCQFDHDPRRLKEAKAISDKRNNDGSSQTMAFGQKGGGKGGKGKDKDKGVGRKGSRRSSSTSVR